MGINFKVSTCAVARALLAECSKAHVGISFITDYFESFASSYSNAKTKRKNEARQCPLLPWRWKRHSNIQYDANPPTETRQKSNMEHSTSQQARQPDRGHSGNSQTAGHSSAGPQNTKAQLPLTREDIPVLVRQVLRALPKSSTSVSTHISTADDPPPSQQNNSSIEEDPPQLLSEL